MNEPQRLDRIEAALEQLADNDRRLYQRQQETAANLDKLSQVVNTLAESVIGHERQIEQLAREWQAYLRTIHPRQ
jgi:cell division septum initiation protein DivIVA